MLRPLHQWSLCLFPLLIANQALAQDPVIDDGELGLRFTLPEGWSAQEPGGGMGRQFDIRLEGEDRMRLGLRVFPTELIGGAAGLRKTVVGQVVGDTYEELELFEAEFLGGTRLGLSVIAHTDPDTIHVRQVYVEHGQQVLMCESFVGEDAREEWNEEALARLWSGLELLEPIEAAPDPDAALKALARKCGTQIPWAATWEEAAQRARDEGKPILVHTRIYPGFALSDDTMVGPYMDRAVVALIRTRYVPYKLTNYTDVPFADAQLYGLSAYTFGTSIMVAHPDGRVLGETVGPVYPFLLRGLTFAPELRGPEVELPTEPVQLAGALIERGELDAASALLTDTEASSPVLALRARIAHLRQDAQGAHDLWVEAGAGPGSDPLTVDLAIALVGLGRADEGGATFARFLAESPDHPRALEARYWLALLEIGREGDEGMRRWRVLAEEHPDDPWGWRAAGSVLATAFNTGMVPRLTWPSEAELSVVAPFVPGPLPIAELARAEAGAVEYLLATQQASGCWLHGGSRSSRAEDPNDLRLAITAICGSALIEYRQRPEVARALERALAWLVADYAHAMEVGQQAYFMDYSVWSRPYAIAFLADCVAAGVGQGDELAPVAARMIADLERSQRSNGGWSYYMTSDLDGPSVPEHSISFTTAAVVLGLVRAQETGFPVPAPVLERAYDCLEGMRDPAGNYTYFLWEKPSPQANPVQGAAGRGPACTLALLRGGRERDLDSMRQALQVFIQHRSGLMVEQGKALMHCGPYAEGSHWVTFDYATAAMGIAALPAGERVKYREPLLEALLACRGANGGFLDNPALGWATGTGLALHAIQALK